MSATYIPIASTTLSSNQATVVFSNIPATYTDLVLRFSARSNRSSGWGLMTIGFNSSAVNITTTYVYAQGGTIASGRDAAATSSVIGWINANSQTSNTFASGEIYIPNYANTSANKQFGGVLMTENNATDNYIWAQASLGGSTAAISSITLGQLFSTNFVSGSTFHLYGISNA